MFSIADILNKKTRMPSPAEALPGREQPIPTARTHYVSGRPLQGELPDGLEVAYFGMGCFWGAERMFWQTPGVYLTSVGFAGGTTPNPTYRETCTGLTGHAEVVRVVYDPTKITYPELLKLFWENHDPTQGMRQGNDVGTTYRSVIYATTDAQLQAALASRAAYGQELASSRYGEITTEIEPAPVFYLAEEEHQQYLAKNPGGYCNLRGTGVACVGMDQANAQPAE
jgi:peptide-methionine (S)-S-oxide reductase